MITNATPLLSALKNYLGFASSCPLQPVVIRYVPAGQKILALLSLGGGKYLRFRLPALVRPGLTAMVSPLITSMKDQRAALQVREVTAALLNSALNSRQSRARLRGLLRLFRPCPNRTQAPPRPV